jgi:hypothetical protein
VKVRGFNSRIVVEEIATDLLEHLRALAVEIV